MGGWGVSGADDCYCYAHSNDNKKTGKIDSHQWCLGSAGCKDHSIVVTNIFFNDLDKIIDQSIYRRRQCLVPKKIIKRGEFTD
jgi:hypothetical protein